MNNHFEQFNQLDQKYSSFVEADPMRNYLHYPAILKELGDVQGKNVLDVGCGEGLLDERMAMLGAHVVGYDASENLVAIARQRSARVSGMEFFVSQAADFNSEKKFDAGVSVMVLSYAENPEKLQEFFKTTRHALKTNGRFISVTFNPEFTEFGKPIANRRFERLDGNKVGVVFLDAQNSKETFQAELHQFSKEQYEQSALQSGFSKTEWKRLDPSAEGAEKLGKDFWQKNVETQPYALFITS